MNPSVATEENADPTLIRTGNYARFWGYGGQIITNLFAYRATDSAKLAKVADPIGSENDAWISGIATGAKLIVMAHGRPKPVKLRKRWVEVAKALTDAGRKLQVLQLSKDGTPCHPLYLQRALLPVPWQPT